MKIINFSKAKEYFRMLVVTENPAILCARCSNIAEEVITYRKNGIVVMDNKLHEWMIRSSKQINITPMIKMYNI